MNPQRRRPLLPLRLTVRVGRVTQQFELPVDSERCIIVGSTLNADVRIDQIPPIAFYLEREGSGVRLTPAYADSLLRVDARRVEAPILLLGQAIVELSDCRLRLELREMPLVRFADDSTCGIASAAGIPSRVGMALVDESSRTTELLRPCGIAALRQQVTVVNPPVRIVVPDMLPTQTVELDAVNFDEWCNPPSDAPGATRHLDAVGSSILPVPGSSSEFSRVPAATQAYDLPIASPKLACETTVVEVSVARPPSTRTPSSARRQKIESTSESRRAAGIVYASIAAVLTRRPAVLIAGAVAGSLMLVVSLVGPGSCRIQQPGAPTARSKGPTVIASSEAPGFGKNATRSPEPEVPIHDQLLAYPASAIATNTAVGTAVVANADSLLPIALGHLFAGRLPAAEQAYRQLAARHPEDPTYSILTRILGRCNSPDCRPASAMHGLCPTVLP
jgi:hypothetical protein